MHTIVIIAGAAIALWAFYMMIFGGADTPQDSVPPQRFGGGHGGMGS